VHQYALLRVRTAAWPGFSQQEDFVSQESMVETLIKGAGHECIFLPKFHCELNPIEMVSNYLLFEN